MTAPGPPGESLDSLQQTVQRLTQRINELERRNLYSASVSGAGGSLKVKDGAEFSVLHEGTGTWLLHVGIGALNKYFLTIRRDDGTVAFEIGTTLSGAQFWSNWDRAGNIVASDDAVSGNGLARPWLSIPAVNVLSTSIPMSNSASYISTQSSGWVLGQQPYLELQCLLRSDSGGAGNARYTVNGSPVGSTMSIGAGAFSWQAAQAIANPVGYNAYMRVELQVQLTNGVGSVGGVLVATQRQSV